MSRDLNHNGSDKLRKGRTSIAGARYFITLCTRSRRVDLTDENVAPLLIDSFRRIHRNGDIEFQCSTVMPDHIHVLFTLGTRLSLSQVVRKYKQLTKSALHKNRLEWQSNYYDHRLRFEDSAESFARYMFLNPYRKKLLSINETWAWWTRSRNYLPEFYAAISETGTPPIEWLADASSVTDLIDNDHVDRRKPLQRPTKRQDRRLQASTRHIPIT